MDHLGEADEYLYRAEEHRNLFSDADNLAAAGTHAVLALIDIITSDREEEIQDALNEIAELEKENEALGLRVRELVDLEAERITLNRVIDKRDRTINELRDQLDGCNDTLRRHEQAAANAAKTNNDLRKSYE